MGGVIDAKCDHSAEFLMIAGTEGEPKLGGLRVTFHTPQAAIRCRDLLHGRWFDERRLNASVTGASDNPPPMIQPVKKSNPPVEVVPVNKEVSKLDRALAAIEVKILEDPTNSELVANKSGILGLLGRWKDALAAADKVWSTHLPSSGTIATTNICLSNYHIFENRRLPWTPRTDGRIIDEQRLVVHFQIMEELFALL
jgi:hypothetical protein